MKLEHAWPIIRRAAVDVEANLDEMRGALKEGDVARARAAAAEVREKAASIEAEVGLIGEAA